MKVVVIDNFDSFVFNLVRYVKESIVGEVLVMRNNYIDYAVLDACDAILLSPGPGIPSEAGDLLNLIRQYSGRKKILGVCLGHQAIAEAFGSQLEQCKVPIHGKSSIVKLIKDDSIFASIPKLIEVGRYHSWQVNQLLPEVLQVLAETDDGSVMALRHQTHDTIGLQFHPESILTPFGRKMIENWLIDRNERNSYN